MSSFQFDSLGYAERLQQAGVPATQAAVHAKVMAEVLSRSVAFPEDMMRLETSLSQKIETTQLKMGAELEKLRSDTTVLKVMVGFLTSLQLPILFKLYFG